ncbi:hypothetical protein WISP_126125 [Willisornis vidua]|uniref:Uncharacterized protein n=1 Tax=Willisornis vidua TaxID=1566151 RepID=A0ABQ9CVW5_9PASS|nr:hypothetical protein WISP_126125 [Willisornis vidua]
MLYHPSLEILVTDYPPDKIQDPDMRDETKKMDMRDMSKSIGDTRLFQYKKRPKILRNWSFEIAALTLPRKLFNREQKPHLSCENHKNQFWNTS